MAITYECTFSLPPNHGSWLGDTQVNEGLKALADHYGPRVSFLNCSSRFLARRDDDSLALRVDIFRYSDGMHLTNQMVRSSQYALAPTKGWAKTNRLL